MIPEASILSASILVVDDQQASVILLERVLKNAGYTNVRSTTQSREVVELHRTHRFDLILLDLQMPEMDGFQVMDELKLLEADSYLSVLAVTASLGQRVRALQGGAKDFVSKPFDLAEILTRVHNLLEVRLLHEADRAHVRALELLARQDPLTGLANRRAANERVQMSLAHARRNRGAMAVLYLDLDGFKAVNDTWGHGVGDLLLESVAQRMLATVRAVDTVARLGGDEFMVALFQVKSEADACQVAAKLIEAISRPHELDGLLVRITASAGLALHPEAGDDAEALLENADHALYQAKQLGKNAVSVFRPTPDGRRVARVQTSPVAL
ncbi:MAG: diguanylate cyclase [Archangium sp.]|nr:diguanylate cyclase [Archangium sp.]MDP3158247.1 diguanylate cyclase [Archangium sp.]MDP3572492.1 diguanylate cyclase [Archangium sp.]